MRGLCQCGCSVVTNLGAWEVTAVGTYWFTDKSHKQSWLNAGMKWGVNLPKPVEPQAPTVPSSYY